MTEEDRVRNVERKYPRKTHRPYFDAPSRTGSPVESGRDERRFPHGVPVPHIAQVLGSRAEPEDGERPRRLVVRAGAPLTEGAVFVGWPSRWANPFKPSVYGEELSVRMFESMVSGLWNPSMLAHLSDDDYREVVVVKDRWSSRIGYPHPLDGARAELRGKHLGCRCSEAARHCHADVLLKLVAR